MVTADDTFAVLRTEVAELVDVPMKPFPEDALVQPVRRPTGRRRAA